MAARFAWNSSLADFMPLMIFATPLAFASSPQAPRSRLGYGPPAESRRSPSPDDGFIDGALCFNPQAMKL
jgi:hypothetical protein